MEEKSKKKKTPLSRKILYGCGIVIVLMALANVFSGNDSNDDDSSAKTEHVTKKTESKKGSNTTSTTTTKTEKPKVSAEYIAALGSAKTYADTMNMSKAGIYDQLTSDSGDKFPAAAAQYAIDNVKADWNKNALESAKSYQKDQNMSNADIQDQLTSEYGDKFTPAEAQYAIANLNK